ncbi:putative secreted RxLR effector peptide protein [Phytophthora cinnamomi]|uniref:putative secreted RxLR effector peptide protein n=1 Tax=Phytophthora cinnamomi TaxID=4785 RepID=UPI00355A5C04|nr:putative secreted RxLR effector peptide protein [Phytophthora cinnamomi]
MRLTPAFLVLVLVAVFAVGFTSAGSAHSVNVVTRDAVPDGAKIRHLKGSHTQTESVSDEERGMPWESASDLINSLKVKINAKLSGANAGALSKAQIQSVTKEVVNEVKKKPKVWPPPRGKKVLKLVYGAVLVTFVTVAITALIHARNNYT